MSAYFGGGLREQLELLSLGFENIEVPEKKPLRVRYATQVT
jgi:hypothetical protein